MTPGLTRGYVAGNYSLVLDGIKCGFIKSVDGGNAHAEVISEASGPDYYVRKHIGNPKYEDFTLQVGLQMAPLVYEWLSGSWKGVYQHKNGAIISTDYNRDATNQREFFNALITETTFPACDGSSKELAYITLKFAPEFTRTSKASGKVQVEMQKADKAWLSGNFRLEIAGLDCSHVSKVDSFTIKQTAASNSIGELRDYQKEPGKLEFPDLKITIAETNAQSWFDWFEDFVIKGNNDQSKEKNGALILYGADFKAELARINFFNMGIFKIASGKLEANIDQIRRVTAELYCERMEFAMPGVQKVFGNPVTRDFTARRLPT